MRPAPAAPCQHQQVAGLENGAALLHTRLVDLAGRAAAQAQGRLSLFVASWRCAPRAARQPACTSRSVRVHHLQAAAAHLHMHVQAPAGRTCSTDCSTSASSTAKPKRPARYRPREKAWAEWSVMQQHQQHDAEKDRVGAAEAHAPAPLLQAAAATCMQACCCVACMHAWPPPGPPAALLSAAGPGQN